MKKAFTLIELLVLIVIVALLAACILPIFLQAKKADTPKSSVNTVSTERIITDEKGRTFRVKGDGTLEEIKKS